MTKHPFIVSLALTAAVFAQAPKTYGSLADINKAFDAEATAAAKKVTAGRLAAIEAYVGNAKNAAAKDLGEARLRAAEIAMELEKPEVAKGHAEKAIAALKGGDGKQEDLANDARLILGQALTQTGAPVAKVSEALKPIIDAADMTKGQKSVMGGIEAMQALSEAMVDAGDAAGALKAWEEWHDRMAHPQLQQMAKSEMENIKAVGTAPLAFNVKDTAGKDLSLEQYKGKVVLIDFWATWCGPCKAELPNVIETYKKWNASGFEVLGISLDQDKDALDAFLKSNDMPWRQHFDGKGWENEIAQLYGVRSIPATYLLDRDGKIVKMNVRGEALKKAVAKLCAPAPKK